MSEIKKKEPSIEEVRSYWSEKNIPQQWYSKKDKFTKQWYNEIARQRYENYYPYLKKMCEFEYHSGEKVLEVGVGMGTDLLEYAKNGALVYGIDLGPDQIEFSKNLFSTMETKYEDLKVASAEDIPYENETFDLVYSFGVLHHTPNTEKSVDEVYRVLKKDGSAIIMLYAPGWKHYLKRVFIQGIIKGKLFRYKFNFRKLSNDVSEVHGNSPKTDIYTRRRVKKLFKKFDNIEIYKCRLGEFFDYAPYQTIKFPSFIKKLFELFSLEGLIGENFLIKVKKTPDKNLYKDSLINVLFKHY
jgi:ubiquinone/menaquinone biosynthesis C-methylase UbiE